MVAVLINAVGVVVRVVCITICMENQVSFLLVETTDRTLFDVPVSYRWQNKSKKTIV